MPAHGVTSAEAVEVRLTRVNGARATSWCNRWNSTLLGQRQQQQQQWPTILCEGHKRNRKLGIRETEKMAYSSNSSSPPPPPPLQQVVAVVANQTTPFATSTTKQEAPLIIDLNLFVCGDPSELVNWSSSCSGSLEEEEEEEEEDKEGKRGRHPRGQISNINHQTRPPYRSSHQQHLHHQHCQQLRTEERNKCEKLAARKLDRKVKECDFREKRMMANDDGVVLGSMREPYGLLVSWNGVCCNGRAKSEEAIEVKSIETTSTTTTTTTTNGHNQAKSSNGAQERSVVRSGKLNGCKSSQFLRQSQATATRSQAEAEFFTKTQPTTPIEHRKSKPARHARKFKTTSFHHHHHLMKSLQCDELLSKQQMRNLTKLAELVFIIYIFIFTSSHLSVPASATNYWPLTRSAHKQLTTASPGPDHQQKQSAARLGSHRLMIGQHYNNFSSIVPYSIVQDSDYGSMQDELVDQLEEQQQQRELQQLRVVSPQSHELIAGGPHTDQRLLDGQQNYQQLQHHEPQNPLRSAMAYDDDSDTTRSDISSTGRGEGALANSNSRALLQALSLDSNRLMLPQMQQIKSRFNQGCVGGTKCQFFAFCWMSGGSLGASCGLLMTCCVTPSRQEIQPGFYGPVVNDPYCGRSTSKINRIVGGTDASFGQFPWQAFVQVGGSRCGGALISSRHVVTAGHCVARSQHSPSSIKVTLGDYILNSDIESIPHEVFSVVEVLLHPNFRFTPQADRYDVAVLELDRTASYKDNIKPICLPQKDAAFVGRVAYVAGWGALQAGSKLRPKVLQHVAVPVIENHVCESWHRRKGIDIRIYDEMMCAGYELGQRDACQGDSGGPLMLNQFGVWYLVGIVSAGYSCAKQYQPGIYHRVSSSSDWISSNIYQQGANK